MIKAIAQMGNYSTVGSDALDIYTTKYNLKSYPQSLVVNINTIESKWDVFIEENTKKSARKHLYKKGPPNGAGPTPNAMITKTILGTFESKMLAWFEKYTKESKGNTIELFTICKEILFGYKQEIIDKLKEKSQGKNNFALILMINSKYLSEVEEFVNYFLSKLTFDDSCDSSKNGLTCSVCNVNKSNIIDSPNYFKFYTIDKEGFIIGGFNEIRNKLNYPVCQDCEKKIIKGLELIKQHLEFNFYGFKYKIIFRSITGNQANLNDLIDCFADAGKRVTITNQYKDSTIAREDDLLAFIKDEKDHFAIDLLFIEELKAGAVQKIVLHIHDVLPSRLRKIFEAKSKTDAVFSRDGEFKFTFGNIWEFFNKSDSEKNKNDLANYFFEIVNSVFVGKPIEFTFLAQFYMLRIRKEFLTNDNDKQFIYTSKNAQKVTKFFNCLNILKHNSENYMANYDFFNEFLSDYGEQLDSPEKKGVFFLGALVEQMLYTQKSSRNADPFWEKLKSLKMGQTDFLGLLSQTTEKMHQYDKLYSSDKLLIQIISDNFLRSSKIWKISVDELNYLFVAGMSMQYQIYSIINQYLSSQSNKENQ